MLNIDLNDNNWLQASLPAENVGLEIRSVTTLAPSVFWPLLRLRSLFKMLL